MHALVWSAQTGDGLTIPCRWMLWHCQEDANVAETHGMCYPRHCHESSNVRDGLRERVLRRKPRLGIFLSPQRQRFALWISRLGYGAQMGLFEPVTHLAFMRAVVASGRKAEHHCGHCGHCGGGGFDSELARVVPWHSTRDRACENLNGQTGRWQELCHFETKLLNSLGPKPEAPKHP